eukprot:gene13178-9024_t
MLELHSHCHQPSQQPSPTTPTRIGAPPGKRVYQDTHSHQIHPKIKTKANRRPNYKTSNSHKIQRANHQHPQQAIRQTTKVKHPCSNLNLMPINCPQSIIAKYVQLVKPVTKHYHLPETHNKTHTQAAEITQSKSKPRHLKICPNPTPTKVSAEAPRPHSNYNKARNHHLATTNSYPANHSNPRNHVSAENYNLANLTYYCNIQPTLSNQNLRISATTRSNYVTNPPKTHAHHHCKLNPQINIKHAKEIKPTITTHKSSKDPQPSIESNTTSKQTNTVSIPSIQHPPKCPPIARKVLYPQSKHNYHNITAHKVKRLYEYHHHMQNHASSNQLQKIMSTSAYTNHTAFTTHQLEPNEVTSTNQGTHLKQTKTPNQHKHSNTQPITPRYHHETQVSNLARQHTQSNNNKSEAFNKHHTTNQSANKQDTYHKIKQLHSKEIPVAQKVSVNSHNTRVHTEPPRSNIAITHKIKTLTSKL